MRGHLKCTTHEGDTGANREMDSRTDEDRPASRDAPTVRCPRVQAREDFEAGEAKTGMCNSYNYEYGKLYALEANRDARTA